MKREDVTEMTLTIEEAADIVGRSYQAISKACQRKVLRSTWFGKQRQIKLSDLLAWDENPLNHKRGRRRKVVTL